MLNMSLGAICFTEECDYMVKVRVVANDDLQLIDVPNLASDQVYIIPDASKRKIYIWTGKECPKLRGYKAGTLATKFKSQEKLYGYEMEKLEEGAEPEGFMIEGVALPKVEPAPLPAREAYEEPAPKSEAKDPIAQIRSDIDYLKRMVDKIWDKVKNI
jgi:hypothetical protein